MNVLAIDTSTSVLGVAILKEKQVIGEYVTNLKKNHSVRLMPAIVQIMDEVCMTPEELDKIVVAKGPGSYTGVRIGLTTAKSMAWALNIPIIGVSTLEMIAYKGRLFNGLICPFLDARRNNVFTGLYQFKKDKMIPVKEDIHTSFENWLENLAIMDEQILFLSPEIDLYKNTIKSHLGDQALIMEDTYHIPRPSYLELASIEKEANSVYTLTPNYLRLAEAEAKWLEAQKDDARG